ncbi:MAG: 2-hydroxyacid dehydrogenase [Treponema sp.]|nr:2-hydroxyacid dehydrogenase [Treponema sp.]
MKIAFFDTKPYDRKYFDEANKKFNFTLEYYDTRLSDATVRLAEGSDVVCAFVNDRLDNNVINKLMEYNVKLIALRCAGYNNVDIKAAYNNIHIVRVPAYSPNAVAEHAVALILALIRHIPQSYNRVREGNFLLSGLVGYNLNGRTAGIVGTGKIGKITAEILKGFGMTVIAYDKFPDNKWAEKNSVLYGTLDELCQKSDIISLHSPLTSETYHLINEKTLSMMKNDIIIINTGRGGLIETKALVNALKSKKIGGAGLDVYEEEDKYFFEDWSNTIIQDDVLARLLTFPNVILTGHQSFLTDEALAAIALVTLENIQQFVKKEKLANEICYQCIDNGPTKDCNKSKTGKCF